MEGGNMMPNHSNLAIAWEHIKLQISPFCSMAALPHDLVNSLSEHEKNVLAEGLKYVTFHYTCPHRRMGTLWCNIRGRK